VKLNFKEFFLTEDEGIISVPDNTKYLGHAPSLPDTAMLFPTGRIEGQVFGLCSKGKKYCFNIAGGSHACIDSKRFEDLGDKAPKNGDRIQLTYYKYGKTPANGIQSLNIISRAS